MIVHVLVEGPSERALLERWMPRFLKGQACKVHPHQGKGSLPRGPEYPLDPRRRGLLDQLPAKLRGFAQAEAEHASVVVVLVDADDEDPATLACSIQTAATQVAPNLSVKVCLAIEETEAFYLGDLKALAKAFPDADLEKAREYQPDSICGTWELFGDVVGDDGGNKVDWAERMGPVLTTQARASRSPSFRKFIGALGEIQEEPPKSAGLRDLETRPAADDQTTERGKVPVLR